MSLDGQKSEVKTALGTIRSNHMEGSFKVGDKVALSVRPEAVAIDWDNNGTGENPVELKVEHLTYLGESEQFLLKGAGDIAVKVNFYHAPEHNFGEGDKLRCFIPASDALVLPPQVEMGPGT